MPAIIYGAKTCHFFFFFKKETKNVDVGLNDVAAEMSLRIRSLSYATQLPAVMVAPKIPLMFFSELPFPSIINCVTVVPALGDPRLERPPALYGHVINAPTDTFQC